MKKTNSKMQEDNQENKSTSALPKAQENKSTSGLPAAAESAGGAAGDGQTAPAAAGKEASDGTTPTTSDGTAPNPAHPDAQQDMDLIKKILSEYLGDEMANEPEAQKMCGEMHQGALADGHPPEQAAQMAGHAMKMAQIMGKKQSQSSDGAPPAKGGDGKGAPAPADGKGAAPAAGSGAADAPPGAESKESGDGKDKKPKEANADAPDVKKLQAEVARLTGENVSLKEAQRKALVAEHLDKVCRESNFSNTVTKSFRKIVENAKSTKEIDDLFTPFKEAVMTEAGRVKGDWSFEIQEKNHVNPVANDSGSGSKVTSFADCIKE